MLSLCWYVVNQQQIYGDELSLFADKHLQKEVSMFSLCYLCVISMFSLCSLYVLSNV